MGFIVRSVSKRTGEPPYQITKVTKKDALDAAIGFLAQGMKDVTITDEKGQHGRVRRSHRKSSRGIVDPKALITFPKVRTLTGKRLRPQ
jgi:hypothetical protein